MKNGVLLTALLLASGTVVAGQPIAISFGQSQGASAAASSGADIVKVMARGVGVTKESALKDAYRDAVERAVGLYVDAEQMVKNDELVKDQVLTQSNAYIQHYDEVETRQIEGLVEVRILATVQKRALASKLQSVMPPQTVRLDTGILKDAHAQMVSSETRAVDGAALLKNVLDKIDPVRTLIVAGMRQDTMKVLEDVPAKERDIGKPLNLQNDNALSPNSVILRCLFELKLDQQKYFDEFLPSIQPTLEQIAKVAPRRVRISRVEEQHVNNHVMYAKQLREYKAHKMSYFSGIRGFDGFDVGYGVLDDVHVYSASYGGKNHICSIGCGEFDFSPSGRNSADDVFTLRRENMRDFEMKDIRTAKVRVVSRLNPNRGMGEMSIYELDGSCIKLLNDWYGTQVGGRMNESRKVFYNIILSDADGNELFMSPWEVPVRNLLNMKLVETTTPYPERRFEVFVAPFVAGFGTSYIEWKDLVVDKDLLPKIATVKIELAE